MGELERISDSVITDLLPARSEPASSIEEMRWRYSPLRNMASHLFYTVTALTCLPPGPVGTPDTILVASCPGPPISQWHLQPLF